MRLRSNKPAHSPTLAYARRILERREAALARLRPLPIQPVSVSGTAPRNANLGWGKDELHRALVVPAEPNFALLKKVAASTSVVA